MSDEAELEALLRQLIVDWENEVVEFKAAGEDYSTGTIGKYFSALSNEANLRGNASAWLVFGVDNKTHTIVGTKYGKEPERLSQLKMQITRDTEPRSSFKDIHELNLPEGRVLMFDSTCSNRTSCIMAGILAREKWRESCCPDRRQDGSYPKRN